MFRPLRLSEAFEHLVTFDEWRWFAPMARRNILHIGVDGWPLFPEWQMINYDQVWQKGAELALQKLRSGEWVADGISSQYGPHPMRIDTNLWAYLRLVDYAEEAEGSGFHFIAITVSQVRLPEPENEVDLCQPYTSSSAISSPSSTSVMDQCVQLFEELDKELSLDDSKKVFFRKARDLFGQSASERLLKRAWKVARLDPVRSNPGTRPYKRTD